MEDIQASLLEEATAFRDSRTTEVTGVEEALEAARTGFAILPWSALGDDGEDRLAAEGVTVRCLQRPDGTVPDDYDEGDLRAIVARAY
jgi:prolyl-tRNA synthetase